MKIHKHALRDAIDAMKWVNGDWLKKPILVEWGSVYCIGRIEAVDPQTGFCHITYKTGFQEKIFIGSRKFYFLADPSFLFHGVREDEIPKSHHYCFNSFVEK